MTDFEGTALYCIDLDFVARRKILSLPPWHGARWHALLRECCHALPFELEEIALSCRPARNGAKPILPGERLLLHLLAPETALPLLHDFFTSIAFCQTRGEFSAKNLEFLAAFDAISDKKIWEPLDGKLADPVRFQADFLLAHAEALAALDEWTLRFVSPLRLPLPPGHVLRGKEQEKYAPPNFLASLEGLEWLLRKLRFYNPEKAPGVDNLVPVCGHLLSWNDMRYSEKRKIALGGICGEIKWLGRPKPETALALALGGLLGAGKNPRFGLGFWQIPELGQI